MGETKTQTGLILASSSPRRRQLLADAGYAFAVIDPPLGEPDGRLAGLPPRQQAEALAYFKARSVAESNPDAMVLAADTVVASGGAVLGKPAALSDARRMLETLSGTRHAVVTGVALLGPGPARLIASEVTHVTMRAMLPEEVEAYLASGEWRGKAGAYAIQETADRFVQNVEGSFTNVVGLPMELVEQMIHEFRCHGAVHKVL